MHKLIIISAISALFTGCIAARFEKTIQVHRDAKGNITEIIETETVIQPGYTFGKSVQPDHIKYGAGNKDTVKISH